MLSFLGMNVVSFWCGVVSWMVFTKLNGMASLRHWFGGGRQNDQPLADTGGTTLQDLPVEVRVQIWRKLSRQDHRAIRQQCKQFQWEINQIVGVHAILKGQKPWKEYTFADEKRWLLSFDHPETKRIVENIEWITNSAVRGLSMTRLSGVSFEPRNLIWNKRNLERLVVQLDEHIGPKVKIVQLLDMCNYLRIIDISCVFPVTLRRRPIESWLESFIITPSVPEISCNRYRNEAIVFTQYILQSLASKKYLKELSICVRVRGLDPFDFHQHTFLGTPSEPTGGPIEYPSGIQVLTLKFPIFKNSDEEESGLSSWKALLDRQTQLTELNVNLGFVHWTYFLNVVHNNQDTMEKLSLRLANWEVARSHDNWIQDVPEDQRLDWTALLPNPINLTSLKVRMSSSGLSFWDTLPHSTRHFRNLVLNTLESLYLRSVHLEPGDFNMLFQAIPSLKNVKLVHWTAVGLPEANLTEIARTTLVLAFHALLTSNQFEKIVLKDLCVRWCPKYLRHLISALPNYSAKWPFFGHYKIYNSTCYLLSSPLTITRKAQNQIIPPLLNRV